MNPIASTAPLWRSRFTVPWRAVAALEAAFGDFALAVTSYSLDPDGRESDRTVWRVELLTTQPPNATALAQAGNAVGSALGLAIPPPEVAPLDAEDWIAVGLGQQTPVRAGRFLVCGRHHRAAARPGDIVIEIDAGMAFGTGQHETTAGCLVAIDRRRKRRRWRRMLDLGTGSGVLAIALAKALRRRIEAIDIDPIAVAVARENAQANGVARLVAINEGSSVPQRGGYDLIVANVLLRPLVRMAPAVARALVPDGEAILAGILRDEEAALTAAFRAQGLKLVERIRRGAWPTLVFQRRRRAPLR